MTCFWDGIIKACHRAIHTPHDISPSEFATFMQHKNRLTSSILWNGSYLTTKQLKENMEAVHCYGIKNINNGYDCSTCDPFLLLICEVCLVHINHTYCGKLITYRHRKQHKQIPCLHFKSNSHHFYIDRII